MMTNFRSQLKPVKCFAYRASNTVLKKLWGSGERVLSLLPAWSAVSLRAAHGDLRDAYPVQFRFQSKEVLEHSN